MQILARGAEAVLQKKGDKVRKERIKKGYRLPQLDELLRKKRTRQELRLMGEARRAGADVPMARELDENAIEMDFLEGLLVKNALTEESAEEMGKIIGKNVAKLHSHGIIHGDLTTSNMILHDNRIFFIDFGLGFRSARVEDKAVDLYLLKETIAATHSAFEAKLWEAVIGSYKAAYEGSEKVIKTLNQIEKRGRYRRRNKESL